MTTTPTPAPRPNPARGGRFRPARWLAAGLPALVLALVVTGCSGGDGSDDTYTPSRPNGTFSPEPTGPVSGSPTTDSGPVTGPKVAAATLAQRMRAGAARSGPASFSIVATGVQPMSANGVTQGTGSSLQLRMNATISAMSQVDIVKKGGVVYLRPPSPMAAGKAWIKITNSANDPFRTFYTTLFQSLETSGDVGATADVIGQMGTFATGANEPVDGTASTKYLATPTARIGVKLLPQTFQSLDDSTLKASRTQVAVWIDTAGRVRRITTTLTLPKAQNKRTAQSLVSFTDWGRPISVAVPPAAQIAAPAG